VKASIPEGERDLFANRRGAAAAGSPAASSCQIVSCAACRIADILRQVVVERINTSAFAGILSWSHALRKHRQHRLRN
jgi:hypothetical protein